MPLIPETHKKPGVFYAVADSGLELPVLDVTHPAFHIVVDEAALFAGARAYADKQAAQGPVGRWLQRRILPFFLRRSRIGGGLLRSAKGYLDGMTTYLMKLGAGNLGPWATPMDKKLVEGLRLSGLSVALRTQDMAETLADALQPLLEADATRPLHFINIAGGPSMDSLNALLLLLRLSPHCLDGRLIVVHILDLESEGAHFAGAALEALTAEGGPLHGLSLSLELRPYNWEDTRPLAALLQSLPSHAIVGASSEGGLFDYGNDGAVLANLKVLGAASPADAVLAASISRPDGVNEQFKRQAMAKLVLRALADLERLAGEAGWAVRASRGRPMNFVAALKKP